MKSFEDNAASSDARSSGIPLRFTVAAGVFALGWHALWFVGLKPAPMPRGANQPSIPSVAYMPVRAGATEGDPGSDLRTIWSPVLFSLPTPVGFSRSAMKTQIGAKPPIEMPALTAKFAERSVEQAHKATDRLNEELEESVTSVLARFPDHASPAVFSDLPAATGVVTRFELLEGEGSLTSPVQLPNNPVFAGPSSWDARAHVEFDENGRVTHLFLDSPSPLTNVNRALVRHLRGCRLSGVAGPGNGRLFFRYGGRRQGADRAANGGAQ